MSALAASLVIAAVTQPNAFVAQVHWNSKPQPISELIYGANDSPYHHIPYTLFRFGGNAATTYNWETNFDNAGSDWQQSSGYGWSMRHTPEAKRSIPAAAIINHHETAKRMNAKSLVQVNLMGYVAADGDGPVKESEQAPSKRWKRVVTKKPGPFAEKPNPDDGEVYVDEMVHYLTNRFGAASKGGIYGYSLDNEPGLWSHTHPRAFSGKTGAKLLLDRSVAAAEAIKAVDPTAKIHGFNPFGVYEYMALTGSPDWPEIAKKGGYAWYIDYYLDGFRASSQQAGRRLLDVLDLHFYVGGGVIEEGGLDAQLQSPRVMWDPTHREQSWLGEVHPDFFPLIPRIKKSIDKYYPGTKLCFSEWNTERPQTLAGGLSTADMLGVFGQKGVFAATWWSLLPEGTKEVGLEPTQSAFRLFRNYDSKGGAFGDLSLKVKNPRPRDASVFVSRNSRTGNLHVVLIGKRRHVPVTVSIPLPKGRKYSAVSFGFGLEWGTKIKVQDNITLEGNNLVVTMPKQSASHIVLTPTSSTSSR
jgi:mannan endo-1,4-beta-mannosidase